MARRFVALAVKQRALELYKEGKTLVQVADILGFSPVAVRKWLLRLEPSCMRRQGVRLPLEVQTKAVELYLEGHSLGSVARVLSISHESVRHCVARVNPSLIRQRGATKKVENKTFIHWTPPSSLKISVLEPSSIRLPTKAELMSGKAYGSMRQREFA